MARHKTTKQKNKYRPTSNENVRWDNPLHKKKEKEKIGHVKEFFYSCLNDSD